MKNSTKILFAALAMFTASSVLAEDIEKTVNADSDGHVDVSIISGSIVIDSWSRDAVEVTGTVGRNVEDVLVERSGSKVRIKLKTPRNHGRGIDADLHIRVPRGSSVNAGTVSADIEVSEVLGDQSLHSVSGDISTEFVGADIQAESVSGDVEINGDGAVGDVEASSVSGDVSLLRVSGDIEVETVTGDLEVEDGSFARADLNTVNGSVDFVGAIDNDGRLFIETVNGSVDVNLTRAASAKIYIETLNGGIRNCFGPDPVRTSKYGPGKELEFVVGNGNSRIDISTVNGGISLCQ